LNKQAIIVSLSHKTPVDRLPGALAYAMPFEGVHIELFCDRIGNAPEITHILEGTDEHSDRGIMKARWNARDFAEMLRIPLAFGPQDVVKLHLGI
jgi:hypothetical protein